MTSHFIEVWEQDLDNDYINNRDQITFGSRINNVITPTKITDFQANKTIIRDTDAENKLFTLGTLNHGDSITPNQMQKLNQEKRSSNQSLYRQYHTNEINSLCFPNIDKNPWGNTTKAIHNSVDKRNKKFSK